MSVFADIVTAATTNGYVTQNPYTMLCWAACSVSILQTKNISSSVMEYTTTVLNYFADVGIVPDSIVSGFHTFNSKITASQSGVPFSFMQIQSYVNVNKPIMALVNWSIGGNHAVVICGYDISNYNIAIMDPMIGWSYPNVATFTASYKSGYATTYTGKWYNSIYIN